ncbi:hypothetical protein KKG19_01675, partial [Patescibacteria group bacterium]|nr:hypothetical protein [Patescibacteria group bacterium]
AVYGNRIRITHDLGDVLLFEFVNEPIDLLEIQERLAGIVKVGEIIDRIELNHQNLRPVLAQKLFDGLKTSKTDKKLKFGISIYGEGNRKLAKDRQKIGLTLKTLLKDQGLSVRYVDSREPVLSSVIVKTNKLIESGAEFVLLVVDKELLIGSTKAVQDFKAWSNRDYGRPARDAKSGMLPPKLARMMVNLSGTEPAETVLFDPFCGSGTVLMEASLMGYKGLIGSDASEKAITASEENLKWLRNLYSGYEDKSELHVSPAQEVDKFLQDNVEAIVSETSLGPPLKGNETRMQIESNIRDLMSMYLPSFETLYAVLLRGGRAVIAFPAFRFGKELIRVPVKEKLEELGWRMKGETLIYEREGQKVAREIFVMEK